MKSWNIIRTIVILGMLIVSTFGTFQQSTVAVADTALSIEEPHAEDVVLVGFVPGTPAAERAKICQSAGAVSSQAISPLAVNVEKMRIGRGMTVEKAIITLMRNPNVHYAEPDYLLQLQFESNDYYYVNGYLWGMYGDATSPENIYGSGAGEAWAAGFTGSQDVYVGVIDEGIQYTHPDLDANIWINQEEVPGDHVDNDGNGYIDDIYGWDFYYNDNSVYDGVQDDHATHVAGTIGGEGGNGIGVAGVNWNVKMISAKFLGPNGGYSSDAAEALDYLTKLKIDQGLNIVATNNSWGGGGFSQTLLNAINRAGDEGILFIAAAGNNSRNNDRRPFYPASYVATGSRGWDCVVSVAAITSSGTKASFSNYGATSVDIGAPGSGIYSTVPTNSYASYSGTSMATPHVAGAIALCAAINPSLTALELRNALLNSSAYTASLAGRVVTEGRLDIGAMVNIVSAGPDNQIPIADSQTVVTPEDTPVQITLTGSDPDGENIYLTFAIESGPSNGTLIGSEPDVTYTPNPNFNGGDSFTFTTNDGSLTSSPATVSIDITPANDSPIAEAQSISMLANTSQLITLTGSDVDGDGLSYSVTSGPNNGSLVGIAPDLTYTPVIDFVGTDSFTFKVSDGELTSEATVSIEVSSAVPSFSMSVSPQTRNIKRGASTEYTITLIASGGFNSEVVFLLGGKPDYSTYFFEHETIIPSGTNTLRIVTTSDTPKGSYVITIIADGGGVVQEKTVSLRVR